MKQSACNHDLAPSQVDSLPGGKRLRTREPGRERPVFELLIAAAAVVFGFSAANAQGVDSPLTQQQFNDYEQNAFSGGLTADDIRFLKDNQIRVPEELSPIQKGGLHNVINDPKTRNDPATRAREVDFYLNLAVGQTIHCAIDPRGANCDKAYQ
jgi:hypothetical protein